MNLEDFNNKILIINDYAKNTLLKKINKLLNIKIITLSELKKNYIYDYDYKSVLYVSNKYNCIPSIARKYIENTYYINNEYKSRKIELLTKIKNDLEENNLLIKNNLYRKFLNNKDIVLYNLKYVDKYYLNIIEELSSTNNIITYNEEKETSVKKIYRCNNSEEEISFVCSKICELIKSGIDINNIKLTNVKSDYTYIIRKTFKLFNIPINIKSDESIKSTMIVKKFKELYNENISEVMDKISELITNNYEKDIYKSILNVVNKYSDSNYMDVKEILFDDIDNIKIKRDELKNAVNIIDFKSDLISDNDYVFLINFNEGIIPINHKDEDYLNDIEKNNLGIDTSFTLNEKETNEVIETIKTTNNLILTYSEYNQNNKIYVSSAYSSDILEEEKVNLNFNNSNNYNKLRLLSEKDDNNKYGTLSSDLLTLSTHYKDEPYLTYNNKYKKISNNKLKNYLNKGLTLSYSSMNTFYQCSFRYYLDNILRVNKYEERFDAVLGSIFHEILSECFINDDYDVILNYEKLISESTYPFNKSEKFFLENLKNELLLIIDTIKEQLKYTSLKQSMYEKEIKIDISSDVKVTFKGFVDKILYDEFNGEKIVVIIDYKTGNPLLNINNSIYGLDMQLPVYIYLIKNEIKNVRIGGFYLQKILSNVSNIQKRKESLKLQGYSNEDIDILEKVDSSYENSCVIKSLRTTQNGFYSYSKIINDEQIDTLYNIVESKVKEARDKILNTEFDINPKEMDDKNIGCKFCKYKDICYMTSSDIVKLKKIDNVFSEVNDNAKMD
ncbi:MAG: PD-(D/E)XK nuclease family protein [Clostridium sp.]|nr:PD-(D/E)XK nuclease family protein [Clostridium sp.]